MKIGARLPDEEYNSKLTPVIVRLFANPDRAIRVCVLDHLPNMIEHLPQKIVNDKIFPQMVGLQQGSKQSPRLIDSGHRICGRRARGEGTNCQGSAYHHIKALGSDCQWGAFETSGKDL